MQEYSKKNELSSLPVNDDASLDDEQLWGASNRSLISSRHFPPSKYSLPLAPVQRSKSSGAICQLGKRKRIDDTRPPNLLDRQPSIEFSEDGAYADHVRKRARVFIGAVLQARKKVLQSGNAPDKSLFTDHAAAQVGQGMRKLPGIVDPSSGAVVPGSKSMDAAHRLNTTFVPAKAVALGMTQAEADDLEALTSGTSQQFQKSNITADKAIDKIQTEHKNKLLSDPSTDVSMAFTEKAVEEYLDDLETELAKKQIPIPAKSDKDYMKAAAYSRAHSVVTDQKANASAIAQEIHDDFLEF